MATKNKKDKLRTRRYRVRNKISGTPERPRLSVYKSNTNVYAQLIDDVNGKTLVAANTLQNDVKESLESTKSIEAAKKVGEVIGKKALDAGIKTVVFDRSGYQYHGKVAAIAEGAREAGLEF